MRRDSVYHLSIGTDAVALRRQGSRHYATARILGRETSEAGGETIWLDRVIAPHGTTTADGWRIDGAVSSVLQRV
jgi:hypothetical protein